MPTLRDRAREALAATEPNEEEARKDLEGVLRRARSQKPRRAWPIALVPALAAAAVVAYLALPHRQPTPSLADRSAPPPQRGVHLYVRATGEPEERAIALDIDSKGDL